MMRNSFNSSFIAVAVLALFLSWAPSAVLASGDERSSLADDLEIRTDTRWAGGIQGGYLPIRVRVVNHGAPRDLLFEMSPSEGTSGLVVRRMIGVEQNATARFTLSLPLVSASDGMLRVYEQGRELKSHSRTVSTPISLMEAQTPAALLVIASTPVECGRYVDAANQFFAVTPHRWGSGAVIDASVLAACVPPTQLPESWIDYSALDFVSISREELERLERPTQTALLKWVQCGGNLLVYQVGKGPESLRKLEGLIGFSEHAAADALWQPADLSMRKVVPQPAEGDDEMLKLPGRPAMRIHRPPSGGSKLPGALASLAAALKSSGSSWHRSPETFQQRRLMLGMVCAFPENPFPGTPADWVWFLNSLGMERQSWAMRHGMSSRVGTEDFFSFLNSDVRGVPTTAFLVLITVFAITIGPVNYLYLQRKKLLWLLLVTVPALSAAASVLLFGYSVAAHGFAVKSRVRSLTVLDQNSRTAVSLARLSMFAGMAPSGGLRFSPETAVYQVFPPMEAMGPAVVDWTQTQALVSGWLPARTRTQFLTMHNAEQRARVELKPAANGQVELANGLPWDLEAVIVCNESGRMLIGREIPANASAVLAEPTNVDLKEFVDLLERNAPEVPTGFVAPGPGPFSGRRSWMRYAMRSGPAPHFASNLMERRMTAWEQNLPRKQGLAPRSYLAVLKQNPGIETGAEATKEKKGAHFLLGYY
jgi:hypothetical protein